MIPITLIAALFREERGSLIPRILLVPMRLRAKVKEMALEMKISFLIKNKAATLLREASTRITI
jgi:hypothetical protein